MLRQQVATLTAAQTRHEQAEARLRRLSGAFEMSIDSIVITDLEGRIVEVNEATLLMYGAEAKEELIGQSAFALIAPEDRDAAVAGMGEVLAEGCIKSREYRVILKDGRIVPVEMSVALMTGADGKPAGFVGISRDITARKRAEEALRESEERYRNLFENANDAIVTFTLEGIVTGVNRGLEAMLGWSREELIGQHYSKFVTPASVALGQERTRRFLAGERLPPIFEGEQVRKDGRVVPVEIRTRAIRDRAGKAIGFQGIYRDISARKALERQRTEFLAMLTHDIRSPLGVILGYTEMLLESAQEYGAAEGVELLERLRSNALTVHSLVSNYLDFSRIETGQLILAKKPFALHDLLLLIHGRYEAEARCRRISLDLRVQPDLPLVEGDAVAMERVFANLLHNALKFTPAFGQVTLSVSHRDAEVIATVADTGPGIPSEEIPFLFEKYRRAATTTQHEGIGLGLFIVRALVEAHGGRVVVQSELGQGTCFTLVFPSASAPKG
ncbi:MAG: PAS domain-containing sensor histidine kinase [Thermodesulfobacteriota bacterium]